MMSSFSELLMLLTTWCCTDVKFNEYEILKIGVNHCQMVPTVTKHYHTHMYVYLPVVPSSSDWVVHGGEEGGGEPQVPFQDD